MKGYPWYLRLALWFVKTQISYDTETGGLEGQGEIYYTTFKQLWGVTYILDQGSTFLGARTGRFSGRNVNKQSIPRSYDLYQKIADEESVDRNTVKSLALPIMYGMGSPKGQNLENEIRSIVRLSKSLKGGRRGQT